MKLNFSIKDIILIFKNKTYLFFWVALGIIILMDLFVLQKSLNIALQVRNSQTPDNFGQFVRVNFSAFTNVLKQMEDNDNFTPDNIDDVGAFGLAPQKK